MKKNRRQSGFSIIELILVIIVLGIALTPIALLFQNVIQRYTLSETLHTALSLAEQKMEEVNDRRFVELATQAPVVFSSPFSSYSYEIVVSAVPAALAADPTMQEYKQVEVRVRQAMIDPVSLKTIISKKEKVL